MELNSSVHKYNTQRKMDIPVRSYNTDIYKKTVMNMGTKLYNKMPCYIQEMDNYKAFKRDLI
jgi:nicotinic acid phosphoribosyltransferase